MRILATLFPILGWLLIIFGFIDFGVSWGFHVDLTGWPFSAFAAGISGSVLLCFGRQIEKDSQSGSSLKLIRSYLFVFVGFIIFGFFFWSIVNASGLLGDHGLYADQFANQYYTSGTEHLDQKRYSQAIEDLNEAIRLDPQHVNAYYNKGNAYRKLGLYELAIMDFDAYIRLDPDDASAYFKRAYAFDELGQHDRAIEDLDEAIRIDPTYAVAYNNRGVAYQSLGERELAERDFAKAKELGYEP